MQLHLSLSIEISTLHPQFFKIYIQRRGDLIVIQKRFYAEGLFGECIGMMVPFCHQETPCLVQNKLFINCLFENNANFPPGLTMQFLSPLWYSFPTSIARLCSYLHFYCLLTTSSNQMQKANSFFPKIQHLCVSLGAAGGDTQGSTRAQWNNSGQCHDFSIPQLSHPLQGFSQRGG